jgi:hypothetical protein
MSIQDLAWDPIHTSPYSRARKRPADATARPARAIRYRCPITGCFVLVTDEATLEWLARPNARLRCADCGDLHSVGCEAEEATAVAASSARAALADDPAKTLR